MGRLGDADVHAAFVEFRAKETDKCMSAQCLYCQSVRAKNTSRQRQHLLECPNYLNAMKEHNPNSSILEMATNGTPTPAMKPSKKRDHESMSNGFQDSPGLALRGPPVPKPSLERDCQLVVQLNPKIALGKTIFGDCNWVSFISGHWQGRWGKGTVVPGGQEKQHVGGDLSTHLESNFILQTHDHPPAYITVRCEGWRVGPPDVLEALLDSAKVDSVDPKSYSFRTYLHMETGDQRYLHLNTGMWIGSGIQRSSDLVMDFYKVL